jgi:hypothetical protein
MKCKICEREVVELEFHHFFPGKKRRKDDSGIDVCKMCGDQIHLMFSNKNETNNATEITPPKK